MNTLYFPMKITTIEEPKNRDVVRPLFSCSVGWLVGRSVGHDFLKGREISLPCSYKSTCFKLSYTIGILKRLPPLHDVKLAELGVSRRRPDGPKNE